MSNEDKYENSSNDYYNDMLNKACERFIKDVLKRQADDDAPFYANPGCKFTEKVMDYLQFEWMIDVTTLSYEQQTLVIDTINECNGIENANNTCIYVVENLKIFGN